MKCLKSIRNATRSRSFFTRPIFFFDFIANSRHRCWASELPNLKSNFSGLVRRTASESDFTSGRVVEKKIHYKEIQKERVGRSLCRRNINKGPNVLCASFRHSLPSSVYFLVKTKRENGQLRVNRRRVAANVVIIDRNTRTRRNY